MLLARCHANLKTSASPRSRHRSGESSSHKVQKTQHYRNLANRPKNGLVFNFWKEEFSGRFLREYAARHTSLSILAPLEDSLRSTMLTSKSHHTHTNERRPLYRETNARQLPPSANDQEIAAATIPPSGISPSECLW